MARRPDGYHEIETCFFPVPWTDILEIIPSYELGFASSGLSIPGHVEDNLCLKAYQLLKKEFNLGPVKIHLHKILPTGAGLGGGSSDAAHSLRLLNQIFALNLTPEQLKKYAAQLGSDCAFFIEDRPMLGTGRGEILSELQVNLEGKSIVLIHPPVHVSTAEAYAGITPAPHAKRVREVITGVPMTHWKNELINDFEATVFRRVQTISEIKEKLYQLGAEYAAMSGSGSTVFGLFTRPVDLKIHFPGMMYWSGTL